MEETIGGAFQLMLFVFALATVISLLMAWIIRLIFRGIKTQKARSVARDNAANGKG